MEENGNTLAYRVAQLERNHTHLSDKIDNKFAVVDAKMDTITVMITKLTTTVEMKPAAGKSSECVLHTDRLSNIERRVGLVETAIDEIKKLIYKAMGGLVIISIIIQLAMPFVMAHFQEDQHKAQVSMVDK